MLRESRIQAASRNDIWRLLQPPLLSPFVVWFEKGRTQLSGFVKTFVTVLGVVLVGIAGVRTIPTNAKTTPINNPMVGVAVDETNMGGRCFESFVLNTNTSHPTNIRRQCTPGTVMGSVIISRSQAVARHLLYVVAPPKWTGESRQTFSSALDALMNKTSTNLQARHPNVSVIPLTGCGNTSTASAEWHPAYSGDDLVSYETYYRTTDCTDVNVEQAKIHVKAYDAEQSGALQWSYDRYASGEWQVPGEPNIYVGNTYTHNVDSIHNAGYYYQTWVYYWVIGTSYYVNIGPLT